MKRFRWFCGLVMVTSLLSLGCQPPPSNETPQGQYIQTPKRLAHALVGRKKPKPSEFPQWETFVKQTVPHLGKVRLGKLFKLRKNMESKDVLKYALQASQGIYSTYTWPEKDFHYTAYYLNRRDVLIGRFSGGYLQKAMFRRCRVQSPGKFTELRRQIGEGLFTQLSWIQKSPTIEGWNFNPTQLIRTVNKLSQLGRRQAAQATRAYVKLVRTHYICRRHYKLDEYRVLLLRRLLLIKKTKPGYEGPGIPDVRLSKATQKDWPLFPLALEKDIPFLLINAYLPRTGLRRDNFDSPAFAFRKTLLSPSTSPEKAAIHLTASKRWRDLFSPQIQNLYTENKTTRPAPKPNWLQSLYKTLRIETPPPPKFKMLRKVKFPEFDLFHRFMLRNQAVLSGKSRVPIKVKLSNYDRVSQPTHWNKQRNWFRRLKLRWNTKRQDWDRDG